MATNHKFVSDPLKFDDHYRSLRIPFIHSPYPLQSSILIIRQLTLVFLWDSLFTSCQVCELENLNI